MDAEESEGREAAGAGWGIYSGHLFVLNILGEFKTDNIR